MKGEFVAKLNKENQAALPQKVLHKLFDYDSVTGGWVWLVSLNRRIKVGQPAGSLDKPSGYVKIRINGHNYQAHRLAWAYVHGDYPEGEQPFIDHINGKRDDNRITNLKVSSHEENMRNLKMNTRNTSGITGVSREEKVNSSGKIYSYWVAYWCDEKGKKCYKLFSIDTYGEEQSKQMTINYRVEQLRLLELNHGIVYSNRHGQQPKEKRMSEKVITIFRKKRSAEMDKLCEGLLGYGIDPDCLQTIINKEAPDIFTFFRVHDLPTVLLFSDGEEVKRLTGKEITTEEILAFLK